jgi:hypothetical protein
MNENKKREARLIGSETDELPAAYEDEEEGGVTNIDLRSTSDYIAKVARAWAEARKKWDG